MMKKVGRLVPFQHRQSYYLKYQLFSISTFFNITFPLQITKEQKMMTLQCPIENGLQNNLKSSIKR